MSVELRSGESQDSLLKRFRKEIIKTRVLSTYRKKRWFVSRSEERRIAKKKAIRRARRRQYQSRGKRSKR
jgi:small subunit ribosomal protein S21